MIVLDARSEAAWNHTHFLSAVSVPYYEEPGKFIKDIPYDSDWIVTYCAWTHRGYSVQYGQKDCKYVINNDKMARTANEGISGSGLNIEAQAKYYYQRTDRGRVSRC